MHPTQLFVYGTLRHDQREHAKYCRGVLAWQPARLRARVWMLPAGYRLATIPSSAVLLTATPDPVADELRRTALTPAEINAAAAASTDFAWLDGELLTFRDARETWPPLDGWEEVFPGRAGCYARVVAPVAIRDVGETWVATWAYLATEAPAGSTQVMD